MIDNLECALTAAFQLAKKKSDKQESAGLALNVLDGKKHNERSKVWVKFLARELLKVTQASHSVSDGNPPINIRI